LLRKDDFVSLLLTSVKAKSIAFVAGLPKLPAFGVCRSRTLLCLLLVVISPCCHSIAHGQREEIRIVETVWGFDGRVAPGQFNPVSILLDNLTEQPVDGVVRLNAVSGMINRAGGFYEQPVYLAANTRRWVQFYPYVARGGDTWRIVYRTQEKDYRFDELTPGGSAFQFGDGRKKEPPIAVILDQTGLPRQSPTTIKHMAAEIFPPYSTATVMLRVLLMDHVPDWETPRQEALLAWVRNGGQLHLFLDRNGQELRFTGALAALNEPFPQFPLGSGRVTRHNLQRNGISKQLVQEILGTLEPELDEDGLAEALNRRNQQGFGGWESAIFDPANGDTEVFQGLRKLTQPDHAWWLILLLSVVYIGLIFPGCWMLSQKRTIHFLATYGAITGLAVVFSGVFLLIGQRGYGETTVSNAMAIARCDDEGFCSSIQWNSLFVTSGDTYVAKSEGHETLFSAGSGTERADIYVSSGNQGQLRAGIPPFSAQTFLLRRRLPVSSWDLRAIELEASATSLLRATLKTNADFPAGDSCQYYALHRDRMYQMTYHASTRTLSIQGALQKLNDFCRMHRDGPYAYRLQLAGYSAADEDMDVKTRYFDEAVHLLVQRSLLDDGVFDPLKFSLPDDRIRLFIYAPMPDAMHPEVSAEFSRDGRVLYVRDVRFGSVTASESDGQE